MYKCNNCEYENLTSFGLCPECKNGFGELIEKEKKVFTSKKEKQIYNNKKHIKTRQIKNIKDLKENNTEERIKTGFKELDKVLGNGIMKNSLNLIYGQPGIGKSTLLLEVINNVSKTNLKCAYISGEETPLQIKKRYDRLGLKENFSIDDETNLLQIQEDFKNYDFLIIDSIQTLYLPEAGEKGGISQIKACANSLVNFAKKSNKTIILIGQITKDFEMAGPKILEHMVDAVFEMKFYDSQEIYRYIKSNKNRFGNIGELSIFKMEENGMNEIENPSLLFIDNKISKKGAAYSILLDGNKPIFIEVQSLVVPSYNDKNYLQSLGINNKRLNQINAILLKYLNISTFATSNIYSQIRGGLKIKENDTHVDLAVAASIISSVGELSIQPDMLFIGELGLTGEILPAKNEKKLIEIGKKFGFKNIISNSTGYKNINNLYQIFCE